MFSRWKDVPEILEVGCFGVVMKWECSHGLFAINLLRNFGTRTQELSVYNRDEWLLLEELPFHENIVQLSGRFRFRPPVEFLEQVTDPSILDCVAPVNFLTNQRVAYTCDFLVLEYFSGGTLAHYLKHITEIGMLSIKRVMEICLDIAKGVKFLFDHQIVHRDMKLDNLLVSSSGVVGLCDFGLALKLDNPQMIATLSIDDARGGNQQHYLLKFFEVLFFEIALGGFPFQDLDSLILQDIQSLANQVQIARGLAYPLEFLQMIESSLSHEPSRPSVDQVCTQLQTFVHSAHHL
jgi:serine/threonine protein kinase